MTLLESVPDVCGDGMSVVNWCGRSVIVLTLYIVLDAAVPIRHDCESFCTLRAAGLKLLLDDNMI